MARKLRSPTRRLNNTSPFPRIIGEFRSPKAMTNPLQYDSQAAFFLLLYLGHRRDVQAMAAPRDHASVYS